MLYTVAEISKLTNLSKVSIYKRLELKEMQQHISKKQGVTYIDEEGFNLIKDSLKVNEEFKTEVKDVQNDDSINEEVSMDSDDLSLKSDYINYLKQENDRLWKEIQDKSRQLENFQVMLQTEKQSRLQLEAARDERERKLDTFIEQWQEDHRKPQKQKGFFKKIFNR